MSIKNVLATTLNRFRTLSIKHPMGLVYNKGVMTVYQLGSKFNISNLFDYCYMPKRRCKSILLPEDIERLLDVQHYLESSDDKVMVVPVEWGFDILEPNRDGDPLVIHEVRFYSVKNRLVLWFMRFIPSFRPTLKNIK